MKTVKLTLLFALALFAFGCKTVHDISHLKQGVYYSTQIDEKQYFVLVDTSDIVQDSKFKVQGSKGNVHFYKAYLIDNSEFTKPQAFLVNYKKRKPKAFLDGRNVSFTNSYLPYDFPTITEYPRRFIDSLYAVQVYKDVAFAQVEGYWDSNPGTEDQIGKVLLGGIISSMTNKRLNLKMDIYVPQHAGKTDRPLLMMIHGGAFYVGDKATEGITKMCQYFASLGYTTASINYRMGFQPTKSSIERAGYVALQDAHAALRFLIANANKYKIDPEYVFVGGSSAGAITALNLAFMQNKNRPESSYKSFFNKDLGNIGSVGKHQEQTFQIKSILNLWGAVNDLTMLKNNNISVLSYHATRDSFVPYDHDYPMQKVAKKVASTLFTKMYGSKHIHTELKKLGYREKLVSINSDAHTLWETHGKVNETFYRIADDMTSFLYKDIVPNPVSIEQDPLYVQRYYISNIEDVHAITWQCNGGFIINLYDNEIFVIWRADALDRKLITSGLYQNGATFKCIWTH